MAVGREQEGKQKVSLWVPVLVTGKENPGGEPCSFCGMVNRSLCSRVIRVELPCRLPNVHTSLVAGFRVWGKGQTELETRI